MHADDATPIIDPPNPDLDELQQREIPPPFPPVPVTLDGPVPVRILPSKKGPAFTHPLYGTLSRVLGYDPSRAVAILVCESEWFYSTGSSGQLVRWPADVPLPIGHCDEVFARVATDATADLSVITEVYG